MGKKYKGINIFVFLLNHFNIFLYNYQHPYIHVNAYCYSIPKRGGLELGETQESQEFQEKIWQGILVARIFEKKIEGKDLTPFEEELLRAYNNIFDLEYAS